MVLGARMLELGDFVFYSQLLPLQIGHNVEIGEWSVDFLIESAFEAAMLGTKLFDTVLRRHSTSCCYQMRYEHPMLTPFGGSSQAGYAAFR
jgi:hypothetical protein